MQSTKSLDCGAATSEAVASMKEKGYYVFHNVLNDDEIKRLREASRQLFKTKGRTIQGGGRKQANAAVEVPAIQWLYYHPQILACFRQALGTESIMFTSHADVQKDVLGGWHKDDGTDPADPNNLGYFSKFAYDVDDCHVYKMGVYLQDHEHDVCGLSVREGSHHVKSHAEGQPFYTATPAGSVVLFDVRITHSGQFKTQLQRRLIQISDYLPKRYFDATFAKTRTAYRAALGRERVAIFFTFGLPNDHTVQFAISNMRRQVKLTPGTSPKLPANLRKAFEDNHVLLAEDHFPSFDNARS